MMAYNIYSKDGEILFSSDAGNVRQCVEIAIKNKVDLSGANLSGADLSGANLSGTNLRWANLSETNLRWANLSDASGFKHAPINFSGGRFHLLILDDTIFWGCRNFSFEEARNLTLDGCRENWEPEVFERDKKTLVYLLDTYRQGVI